jgi:phenylalanyl-tRNA synthetase alpha subunit
VFTDSVILVYLHHIRNTNSNGTLLTAGIENLRFKPAYNPYTEPSMEIFAWHKGLGKYVEIGNSGLYLYLTQFPT